MFTLKDYQDKAVSQLLDYACDALQISQKRVPILLKAPTGAGKTITMAAFISQLIQEVRLRPNLPKDLAFIWLAPNTLHLQSYESLTGFYSQLNDIKTLKLADLNSQVVLRANELLFLNWSSIDKEKNTFRQDNERSFNLDTLIENTQIQGTKIIVVIDEAHLSAFTGKQAQKVLQLIHADLEISVTATPLHKPDLNVIIQRQKVVAAEMIKKGIILNPKLKPSEQIGDGKTLDIYLLRKAMQKRDEIAQAYQKAGIDINPLLLIQLPSEKATLTQEDKTKKETIERHLAVEYDITANNHLLSVWLSDSQDKVNLGNLEKPNAMQKVLIFKQAISQGWDCPRAAVLLIFREIGNPTFGVQTVGRILRMPQQKHYENELLDFGYVYTNIQSKVIRVVADDLDYFNLQIARRQEDLSYPQLEANFIVNDRKAPGLLTMDFERIFYEVVEERLEGLKQIPEQKLFTIIEDEKIKASTLKNKEIFKQYLWEMNADDIEIQIPTDIEADVYEVNSLIDAGNNMGKFAKTQAELGEMMNRFCYNVITRLNRSKSWKRMRSILIQFIEYYTGFDEFIGRKIILSPHNQPKLTELINLALERYDKWQLEKGNKNRRYEAEDWEIPEERVYPEIYKKQENNQSHALMPFYEYQGASQPEKLLKDYLEKNREHIYWWYKNGDKGKEHFAVPYTTSRNEKSLFYIDFIIYFKDGRLGLFDTKTKNSDPEAPLKHNALLDYMEEENKKRKSNLFGGVLIVSEDSNKLVHFRYCLNRIENTNDLTGWEYLKFVVN